MNNEIGDTLRVMKEKEMVRFYAKLVFGLLLSIEYLWKSSLKANEKKQFRRAGKRAIELFMYLAKIWWSCYGTVPDLADWMNDPTPATDEEIKIGLYKLINLSLPNLLSYRLAKDLMYIREHASRGWSDTGKL